MDAALDAALGPPVDAAEPSATVAAAAVAVAAAATAGAAAATAVSCRIPRPGLPQVGYQNLD